MSLEDFDPIKHGPVALFFAAALGFLLYLLGKAKALFKNGDGEEIKTLIRDMDQGARERDGKIFDRLDDLGQRVSRIEGQHDAWDHSQPDRRVRAGEWKPGREPR